MKKLLTLILSCLLAFTCTVTSCNHTHDENCGYNPSTGEGCTHTCEYEVGPHGGHWPDE